LFIYFHAEENEPKEDARVSLSPVRRRGGRSARERAHLWRVQTVRALYSVRHVDARRGTKGLQPKTLKPSHVHLSDGYL